MAARPAARPPAPARRIVLLALGTVSIVLAGEASFVQVRHVRGTGELWLLTALAVAAGLFSFVTRTPAGSLVVINPAVCFTFAILLAWGLGHAIVAQVAAVAASAWRRGLPPLQSVLMVVQFGVAFVAAFGVLAGGSPQQGPVGQEWTDLNDAAFVIVAAGVWVVAFVAAGYLIAWLGRRVPSAQLATPSRDGLLFNAALVVLSPVIAVTAQVSAAFVGLVLVPLYAVQRMARLSAERERADRLDPLTSLANRTMLREHFDQLAATNDRRTDLPAPPRVALLLLDLDRFKHVNDALGHEVGDRLLTAVADRLSDVDVGLVGRLGGDEFAILASTVDARAAGDLAERAVRALREPVSLDGLRVDVTASAGVALRTDVATDDFAAVLRHADTAMYAAKRQGDTIAIFDNDIDPTNTPARLQLLADFRQALQTPNSDEIALHYQPQVNLATTAIEGLEALLRWTHPTRGLVDAGTILDIAEHTSVMHLLSQRVVDLATAQIAGWREAGITTRVSVNLSTRDLYSEDIVEHLAQQLNDHHIPADRLQVEVTESALMTDPERARITLNRIANLGVGISLDDFGTGYSSLQHLRRLPLAEIKIDQGFVANMTRNAEDAAIVSSTITMAHALGLRTVAEGVPDEPTNALLARMGCDLGQGWHLSRATAGAEIPGLLTAPLKRG